MDVLSREPETPLSWRELMARGSQGCLAYPDRASPPAPDDIVLRGDFSVGRLKSGLSLHTTDAVDVNDLSLRMETGPGLTVAVFLRGRADVLVANRRHAFCANAEPMLLLMARTETDEFVRHGLRGNWVRKVSLGLPPEWIDECAALSRVDGSQLSHFTRRHGTTQYRPATARQADLASRILAMPPSPRNTAPMLEVLRRESHALDLVAEAIAALSSSERPDTVTALSRRDRHRLRLVREFLDNRDEPDLEPIRLDGIARHAGMSASALHRLFRAAYGCSVFEYERERRMERARAALERDRVSVTEAAWLAGYANPANFATAFKRRFGQTPKDARSGRTAS